MRIFNHFRTPLIERIEIAVKQVADCVADLEYHRHMISYFNTERVAINPEANAATASEYARLFCKEEEHQQEYAKATSKHRDASARLTALRGKRPA